MTSISPEAGGSVAVLNSPRKLCMQHVTERLVADTLPCPWCVIDELRATGDRLRSDLIAAQADASLAEQAASAATKGMLAAQEELRVCQQEAIGLQESLTAAEKRIEELSKCDYGTCWRMDDVEHPCGMLES